MPKEIPMPLSMLYPTFTIVPGRGFIPYIRLPENYLALAKEFHNQGRIEEIKGYIEEINKFDESASFGNSNSTEIRLGWDKNNPGLLRHISVSAQSGLDLEEKYGWATYIEHNLGGRFAITTGAIAMKYVSELIIAGE
ncbi:hypothetical protein COU60_04995 [Candidatus Pacearchaeota archaeon CG10_big_fil_rev_8_21_14_0_10_34_76]|nr:MAG: hypothetical protein COU60_04995 [Candidatus Pacearchaeota archaeon CG10_big_fil_rev_8_21_14_0_10_34_76]